MRAFVAFYPDEVARGELVEVAPDDADDVRVTDMADWHVTIRFLGQLDESRRRRGRDGGGAAIAAVPPFTARLGPLTALGTGARVLFVPVRGAEALAPARSTRRSTGSWSRATGRTAGTSRLARARGRGRLPGGLSGLPVSVRVPGRPRPPSSPRASSRTAPCTGSSPPFPLGGA